MASQVCIYLHFNELKEGFSDQPHFQCPVATCGQWPLWWHRYKTLPLFQMLSWMLLGEGPIRTLSVLWVSPTCLKCALTVWRQAQTTHQQTSTPHVPIKLYNNSTNNKAVGQLSPRLLFCVVGSLCSSSSLLTSCTINSHIFTVSHLPPHPGL